MENNAASEPLIEYPCQWEYRVIGRDVSALKKALRECIGDDLCDVVPGKTSAGGKYISFRVTVSVSDEQSRNLIYQSLTAHEAITMVL